MKTTYRISVLGRDGMYTYGETAVSPALAKLVPGNINIRTGDRLAVQEATWRLAANGDGMCIDRLTVVEAEDFAGQWEIGVPNGSAYRAAVSK